VKRLLPAVLSALCLLCLAPAVCRSAPSGPAGMPAAATDASASAGAASSRAAGAAPAREQMPLKPVQVFDVKAGKVVRTVPNDEEFQAMAREWLRSVTGLSPRLRPSEDCGFVYRVPLAGTAAVRIGGTAIAVRDIFLFQCERERPLLLVFDPDNRPYLLQFEADLRPFLRKLAAPEAPPPDDRKDRPRFRGIPTGTD